MADMNKIGVGLEKLFKQQRQSNTERRATSARTYAYRVQNELSVLSHRLSVLEKHLVNGDALGSGWFAVVEESGVKDIVRIDFDTFYVEVAADGSIHINYPLTETPLYVKGPYTNENLHYIETEVVEWLKSHLFRNTSLHMRPDGQHPIYIKSDGEVVYDGQAYDLIALHLAE